MNNDRQGTTLKLLQILDEVADKLAPGRAPYFVEAHLVRALNILSEGPLGRIKLSKTMGLSEGSVRTLTRHLEKQGLVSISKNGITLSNAGKELYLELKARMSDPVEIPESSLAVGPVNAALLVNNSAASIKNGLEQRDAAIKVGALGATTLIFFRGKLSMPLTDENVAQKSPDVSTQIISELRPKENDVIIIGSANDKSTARLGALAAALETLKHLSHRSSKG